MISNPTSAREGMAESGEQLHTSTVCTSLWQTGPRPVLEVVVPPADVLTSLTK